MQGTLRTSGNPNLIKLRVTSKGLPTGATVEVTDLMLQPGGVVSGWLPHVTELPWSAGIVPPEGAEELNARIDALESQVAESQIYLNRIMAPAQVWVGDSSGNNAHVETLWDADLGWVSWIDVAALPGTGDIGFWYPSSDAVQASARPYGWSMQVFTQGLAGVGSLRPRVDYMDGATVTGSNAELSLTAWPDWSYRVEHDFILPASRAARPAFVLVGRTAGATGRIGLTRPKLGTKSERSQ
ncbi:hypothetical protein ACT3UQ_08690 [Glutamicibacter sp. AOP12-B1-11]|uniref:hypothetical protein n=1 Tax=Glutamicibacter sp. AOP12-B1-11 TaxID=3457725 RepID=UPI004033E1C6